MKTKFNGILTLLLAFMVQFTFAQERVVSGVVSDEYGPVADVTVVVKGTTKGTVTDFDGKYSIKAKKGDTLVFSDVAHAAVEKVVGDSDTVNVQLKSGETLETVVVTAMGIKRKPDEITTSTEVVKAKELTKSSSNNIAQALTGKVSGLTISQNSNGVDGSQTIILRGFRSFSGNNEALIVIDGVPSTQGMFSALDPESIKSVNVMKGANGAALYGKEGGNGVIIVETKKGNKSGQLHVSVKSSTAVEKIAYLPERQTRYGQGWAVGGVFQHFVYENGAWGPEFDGSMVPVGLPLADGSYRMMPYETLGSDNIKAFFQNGLTFQNNVSIGAGSDDAYVNFDMGRRDREFIIKDDKSDRTNFDLRAGKTFGKFKVSSGITYVVDNRGLSNGTIYGDLLQTATNIDITQFAEPSNETHWNGYFFSPYWQRDNVRKYSTTNRVNSNVMLNYELNDHINFSSTLNFYNSAYSGYNYNNGYVDPASVSGLSGYTRTATSSYGVSDSSYRKMYEDFKSSFDYQLTEDISLKANAGVTATQIKVRSSSMNGQNLVIPGLYNISNVTGSPTLDDFRSVETGFAVFGDVTFGYKDYLYLNATGRNDWSSTLDPDNRSFFYPSVGLSFIPTKAFDNFGGDILDRMKIALSYVKVGNTTTSPYDINDTYYKPQNGSVPERFYGNFPFGGISSFIPRANITDPNIENEFVTSTELNVNMEFFKRRITLDFAGYKGLNQNQQSQISTSYASGLASNTINIGEAETSGLELDLNLVPIKNENFRWDLGFNYATSKMLVTKVSDQSTSAGVYTPGVTAGIFAEEGEVFPLIKGTDYMRDPEGHVIIDPNSGNPLVNNDFVKLGQAAPKYVLGFNTSFKYKNLTFSATADYRGGHKIYSHTKYQLAWSGYLVESAENGRHAFIFPNSVIETSPGVYTENTNVATGGTNDASFLNYYSSTYTSVGSNLVIDASAFKVREMSLAYDMPKDLIKKTGLSNLSFSVFARNPFTVLAAENKGYVDPEASNRSGRQAGLSFTSNYPTTQTFGATINLTF